MRSLSLIFALTLAACGPEEPYEEAACPEGGTELTYENFGRRFLSVHCQGCHASNAPERRGAPDGVAFDDIEDVHDFIDRIYDRSAGDNVSMPPGPEDPPEKERLRLAEWLACGAPSEVAKTAESRGDRAH